ncbi:BatA domain-containing protein [Planctomicrobium piriforme]|uniref:N-terminal double-transmembrane domain-containing protein n=1 Tax=Planctomicrobium piriforme TaxID=1576369 RepID=A0A1I3AUJ9_9PLAN|nr:BatA domain-containing protein [Planctomicrobium piriforme]SFH53466.1 N-terminal double-transmembrane domain-containing protein [Planctomicrobium piriforme]
MSFLNSSLLLGLGFLALPVILHFLLKQKPKKLLFPALRLLQQRQRQSVRRLRMRHVVLMLLRMLALGIVVFALARPSVPPANYSLTIRETAILLAVIAIGIASYLFAVRRLRRRALPQYQQQAKQSSLRNWTTVIVLAALLLLVGWPYQRRIAAEFSQPRSVTSLDLPVAGVMLFDNSLSMTYLEAGETSLDRARTIAKSHLQSLPTGSRIAVGDTGSDRPIPFQTTIVSAQGRIDSLENVPTLIPFDDRLREAIKSQEDDRRRILSDQSSVDEKQRKDRYIRRVYLFTDLAKSAWRTAGSSLLLADLQREQSINVYLVDVGRTNGRDQAITAVSLSGDRIPVGGELVVSSTLQSQGEDIPAQGIELLFENKTGETIKQGQSTVRLDANLPAQVQFPLISGFTQRWLQGETRLIGSDPLTFDNTRYFTVEVSEPPPVLVLAPDAATAQAWMTALAPHDRSSAALNRFKPHFEPFSKLPELNLALFPAVTMVNCIRPTDEAWSQLGKYVEGGGGLIVILGSPDIRSDFYRRALPQQFLPGMPDSYQSIGEWSFSITERNHPLFSIFRRLENYGSFSMFENVVYVTRFWKVTPAEGAHVLATYSDPEHWPAILERSYGKGRSVMLTTAAHLPDNPNQRWNNLPSPLLDAWLFLSFVEQMTDYVSRFSDERRAFLAGETPVVKIAAQPVERNFLLKQPDLRQSRLVIPPGATSVVIENISTPGHYQLIDPDSREAVGAFSINAPPEESDLTRLTAQDLNDRLGVDRYQIAQSLEELKDRINAADLGQEIFPLLLVLVIVIFCGEHLVANRFYEQTA